MLSFFDSPSLQRWLPPGGPGAAAVVVVVLGGGGGCFASGFMDLTQCNKT